MIDWIRRMAPYRWRLLAAIICGCMTVLSNIGLMGTSGYLISSAALQPETVLLLWIPIVGVRFFGISRGVFRYVERLVAHDVTFRWLSDLRVWLYRQLEPRAAFLLQRHRSTTLFTVMMQDVDQLQQVIVRVIVPTMIALFTGMSGVIVLSFLHWLPATIVGCMVLVAGLIIPVISYRWSVASARAWIVARSEQSIHLSGLLMNLTDWLIADRTREWQDQMNTIQEQMDVAQRSQHRIQAWTSAMMHFATRFTMWSVLLVGVGLVGDGQLSGVYYASTVLIALACFEAVIPLPHAYQQWVMSQQSMDRLTQLAGVQMEDMNQTDQTEKEEITATLPRLDAAELPIRMESVQACYSRDNSNCEERLVLDQIQFEIAPYRKIAVVGMSGAGKSSLFHLVAGQLTITRGGVWIGGMNGTAWDPETLRNQFAVVPQPVQLFHTSIRENIRMAHPEADELEIRRALEYAELADWVDSLPQKEYSLVGECGLRVSGGERQRMGIARAILRDAPIWMFDEPLTGLDQVTADRICKNMQSIWHDKTVLWITHDLTGLQMMDQIIVMHQGRIVESGTFDSLILQGERFAKMYHQQRWMRDMVGTTNPDEMQKTR